ncbi:MAG: hypothetical protein NC429_13775 [Lachnospiraceae bacterium]|nr:hypothetical protein [Lachnospiraceae bacterium]
MLKMYDELKDAVLNEDFYRTNEVLQKIRDEENAFDYVKIILEFIEENPDTDFGFPGPAVHFMEQFYKNGYEKMLLESLNRRPTSHAVWMLNRIINDPQLEEKEKYLTVLEKLLQRDDIAENLREEIRGFLKYQDEK